MREQSPWTPRLSGIPGTVHERLVSALTEDIERGVVGVGARLPAHRDLAGRLGIGIGTVTKAYSELERRGLVRGVHGRGTFVAGLQRQSRDIVDLSVNVPPPLLGDRLLADTLTALAGTLDAEAFARYPDPAGSLHHRAAITAWLHDQGLDTPPERVLLTHGAQHAVSVALTAAAGPSGVILTETSTYPGAIAAARQAGQTLVPVAMDAHGMLPDALHFALTQIGPEHRRTVYVTPTLHNPTGSTMDARRRRKIVEVCRAHDVTIIEDDVYSLFRPRNISPIAQLAPERTFYVNGFSKSLTPGLRIGVLVAPEASSSDAADILQVTSLALSPLMCEVARRWITDGTARHIGLALRAEAEERLDLAVTILDRHIARVPHSGFHLWLPLPRATAEEVTLRAAHAGIIVTPPAATTVDPEAEHAGVRLCLGGPPVPQLTGALHALKHILDRPGFDRTRT
ncbi:PLP-dependent aminotransferase family protein [Rhodococcus sp. O3]|uniref:aminotransferase-like domain-containing protein n=1 Tax=Rhodococcus sp. O3 TaxID=3404919 RepID=UPI003B67599D